MKKHYSMKRRRQRSPQELKKSQEAFRVRKLLFFLCAFSQIINLIIIALSHDDFRGKFICTIILMSVLAIFICCDKRKTHVDWLYIIIVSIVYFGWSFIAIIISQTYWCFWMFLPEILAFAIFTPMLCKAHSPKN